MHQTKKINLSFFFDEESSFPWQWFGGCPVYAPAYVYICKIASLVVKSFEEKIFLEGNPSLHEMQRYLDYAHANDYRLEYCKKIVDHQNNINANPGPNRRKEVFDFLKNDHEFRAFFEKVISEKYRQNYIVLPKGAFLDES